MVESEKGVCASARLDPVSLTVVAKRSAVALSRDQLSTASMAADSTTTGAVPSSGIDDFPQFPGEDFHQHAGALYKEQAEARLGGRGLLAVANGGIPAEAERIVDVDLSDIPELPAAHKDYHRRLELRIKVASANRANDIARYQTTMRAWTTVYSAYKKSTEITNPVLSRELATACDLSQTAGLAGGYFDGPLAHRMVMREVDGEERTEADKAYYRTAERIQLASPLADGCLAVEYRKRALDPHSTRALRQLPDVSHGGVV